MPDPKQESQFVATLAMLRDGALMSELDAALAGLVEVVKTSDKGGKLVLTLDITPSKKGRQMLFVGDTVVIKPPKIERDETLVFATDDNTLSRRDPRQPELQGLRDGATRDVRPFPQPAAAGSGAQ